MTYRTKYYIATVFVVISVGLAILGTSRIRAAALSQDAGRIHSAAFLLFGAAAVGVTAVICQMYFRTQSDVGEKTQQQVEVEMLAELAQKEAAAKAKAASKGADKSHQ